MNAISAWILTILGIVVIGTVVDLILPSGRMNKYLRSVFATVTVLVIVLPLPNLIKNGFKPGDNFFFDGGELILDESYLAYANGIKIRSLEKGLVQVIKDEGITGLEVKITGEVSGNVIKITAVSINLSDVVMDEKYEHINKYELVEGLVTKYLNIKKELVQMHG